MSKVYATAMATEHLVAKVHDSMRSHLDELDG